MARLLALSLLVALTLPGAAPAETPLRVGTSGDYAPFSQRGAGGLEGFDIDVARAYAKDRGLMLEFVPFTWPRLLEALAAGEFDVAMSGVTQREERSLAGRFTAPLVETGAVVLVAMPTTVSSLAELDQIGTRIGVNAGGHLERVTRRQFQLATLLAIADNASVLAALATGSVEAVVTDSMEAPAWEAAVEDVRRFGPFTRDRKAYLVHNERADLALDLDAWLLEREADGSLQKWRSKHFGRGAGGATATPVAALVAAMDERLTLMPSVAAVKRANGQPIAVPARERKVLDATVSAVREVAEARGVLPPREAALRAFMQTQMDAAKAVQMAAVRDPAFAPPEQLPDLDTELRPALLRIGERIAALILALPVDANPRKLYPACRDGLRAAWLHAEVRDQLCVALRALSAAPRGEAAPDAPEALATGTTPDEAEVAPARAGQADDLPLLESAPPAEPGADAPAGEASAQ